MPERKSLLPLLAFLVAGALWGAVLGSYLVATSPYVTQRRSVRTWVTTGDGQAVAAAIAQHPRGGAVVVWGCVVFGAVSTAYFGLRWLRKPISGEDEDT